VDPSALARTERERLRAVLQTAREGLLAFNDRTQVSFANPAAEALVGRTRRPLLRTWAADLLAGADGEALETAVQDLLTGDPGASRTLTFALEDGGPELEVHLVAARANARRVVVASLRRAAVAPDQAVPVDLRRLAALGRLTAGIGSDLAGSLQTVGDDLRFVQDALGGLVKLARACRRDSERGAVGPELTRALEGVDLRFWEGELGPAVEQALDGVARMGHLTAALRGFVQLDQAEEEPIDVNQAVRDAVILSRTTWTRSARVRQELAPEVPPVVGWQGELQEVLVELITNAAHAIGEADPTGASEPGTITVRTRHVAERVEVVVADTGIGIPEAIQDRVFERFFTTRDDEAGGQGLATARALVERAGGSIDFRSEPGRGTSFVVRLPAVESMQPPVRR